MMNGNTLSNACTRAAYRYIDADIANRYFSGGGKVALALSGGADSVFLLHLLYGLACEGRISLYAIHVNHMIRGEEADRDEIFCREMCKSLGVGFFCERKNVPLEAKKSGKTLEEAARDARYSCFEAVMRREDIPVIATAHNANDLAENILIRLIRGTSLDGICGIPRERTFAFGRVVRPVLSVTKKEICDWCEEHGIRFVTDSTNLCDAYTRNRIRNRIIPVMEELNPSFLSVSGRNAALFYEDSEYLKGEADKIYGTRVTGGVLSLEGLSELHTAILSRVISRYCTERGARPEREHVERLVNAIRVGENTSLSLPGKRRALIGEGALSVIHDSRGEEKLPRYSFRIFEGENHFEIPECGLYVTASLRKAEDFSKLIFDEEKYSLKQSLIYNLSTHKVLNFDTIKGELFLRSRREGDIIDFGSFCKSVKKLMNEKKIPSNLRDALPLLCEGEDVIYVPFAAEARRCHPDAEKQNLYIIDLNIKFNLTEE